MALRHQLGLVLPLSRHKFVEGCNPVNSGNYVARQLEHLLQAVMLHWIPKLQNAFLQC